MKLAISGKGGVGKSTLAGTLARLYANDGRRVLAIDADPDANLASALGLTEDLKSRVKTISDQRQLIEERTGARVKEFGQIFSLNPDVKGIAEACGVEHKGVYLVVLGAIQNAGAGCACPESVLLKSLVRDLVLNRDDVVILDMEAGIEHLGRGSAMGVDLMISVIEPGLRSMETARRVRAMAAELGIKKFAVVMNKAIGDAAGFADASSVFGEDCVLGVIPYDTRMIQADASGKSLVDLGQDDLLAPFALIKSKLEER